MLLETKGEKAGHHLSCMMVNFSGINKAVSVMNAGFQANLPSLLFEKRPLAQIWYLKSPFLWRQSQANLAVISPY